MKKQLLLITIFCLISNLIFSSDGVKINLATPDKTRLLENATRDFRAKKKDYNWPKDVKIRFEGCYLLDNEYKDTENPRYKVRIIGSYKTSPRETITQAVTIQYFKNELNKMGVDLPE